MGRSKNVFHKDMAKADTLYKWLYRKILENHSCLYNTILKSLYRNQFMQYPVKWRIFLIYLGYRSASKMNPTQRWVYNVFLMKTIGVFIDNAVNTRFVFDAIMHIFACKNDWDLCIALKMLYNWHLPSWGCSEYTNASNEPKKVWHFNHYLRKFPSIAYRVYVYPFTPSDGFPLYRISSHDTVSNTVHFRSYTVNTWHVVSISFT